jgi:hypothetical protein
MDTVINSWPRNCLTIRGLSEAIAAARPQATVLLAVRVLDLERVAWREGRRRARIYERLAVAAFLRIGLVMLRPGDAVAHEPGSDVFLAALLPPVARPATRSVPHGARRAGRTDPAL